MAEFSPVLPMRDGGGRLGQPIFPRSRSGSESESELSQSLARTKIRSYGSTASVTASLGEKFIEHRVTDSDTLQGIALKYGVTVRLALPCDVVSLYLREKMTKIKQGGEEMKAVLLLSVAHH